MKRFFFSLSFFPITQNCITFPVTFSEKFVKKKDDLLEFKLEALITRTLSKERTSFKKLIELFLDYRFVNFENRSHETWNKKKEEEEERSDRT